MTGFSSVACQVRCFGGLTLDAAILITNVPAYSAASVAIVDTLCYE